MRNLKIVQAGLDGIIVRGLRHFTVFADKSPRIMGQDSSVGIASRYGLDGSGIESWWGRDFPHPSRPTQGPTHPPIQWRPGLPGVKRSGLGVDHPPPSSAEVKERVELYLFSPHGPS